MKDKEVNNRNFLAFLIVIVISSWLPLVYNGSEGSIELLIAPTEGFQLKLYGNQQVPEELDMEE